MILFINRFKIKNLIICIFKIQFFTYSLGCLFKYVVFQKSRTTVKYDKYRSKFRETCILQAGIYHGAGFCVSQKKYI